MARPFSKGKKATTGEAFIEEVVERKKAATEECLDVFGNALRPIEGFIRSGSTTLDLVNGGGGYPLGRVACIGGMPSSGKTLLAMEAAAHFHQQFNRDGGVIWYVDAENAFTNEYAKVIGFPQTARFIADSQGHCAIRTVEQLGSALEQRLKLLKEQPALFILDSLDALSTNEELSKDMDENTMAMTKARVISEFFRRYTAPLAEHHVCFFLIQQMRQKMSSYGTAYTKAGGNAPNFYASLALRLTKTEAVTVTRNKEEREIGVNIDVKNEKNKVGWPHQKCSFQIRYDYGIYDILSCVEYLDQRDRLDGLPDKYTKNNEGKTIGIGSIADRIRNLEDRAEYDEAVFILTELTKQAWGDISEAAKMTGQPKYIKEEQVDA